MGSPPIQKNGIDHRQDVQIRELDHRNTAEHSEIKDMMAAMRLEGAHAFERLDGKINGYRLVVIVGFALVTGLGGLLMDAHLSKLEGVAETTKSIAETVVNLDKRQESWEKFATGWGEKLEEADNALHKEHEADVKDLRQDIKEVSRSVSRHRKDD